MNEEPKSIWKKSLPLPGLFLAWLALMAVTTFIIAIVALIINQPLTNQTFTKSSQIVDLLLSGSVAATALLGLWLFIRWVGCGKHFRRFLFGCACLATLIGLFYAEENWRGKHDWDEFKSDWEAKGEKFDFNDYVPPTVSDNDNFAMAPIFDPTDKLANRKWRNEHRNRNPNGSGWDVSLVDPLDIRLGPEPQPDQNIGDWRKAEPVSLQVWQKYYRELAAKTNTYPVASQPQSPARDVLLALSIYDTVLEHLRQASLRPESRFPLDYDDEDPAEILLPHLAALKRCSLILRLRALAELENGQSDKALDDVKLSLRLADAMKTEPFIITHLVRIAILQITLQPIWEGLAGHKWSDAQLVELDSALKNLNFLADYQLSVRGERVMHIKVLNWMEQKRSRYWNIEDMVDSDEQAVINNFGKAVEIYLMPKGWYYQNALTIARLDQNWILPAADEAQQTISPKMISQAKATIDSSLKPGVFSLFARLLVPALENYSKKAAYGQNEVSLARAAIALERYRLARGEYPETLEALAPQFIAQVPHDIIGGQPLKYRHEANGQFILYSIGWNETDDGGVLVFHKGPANKLDREIPASDLDLDQGDWVWRYPEK
jgi:hypothetical protein